LSDKIAYCGIDCGACPALIATVNNDLVAKEKVANEWSSEEFHLSPKDVNCLGCRSDTLISFAKACPTRLCAMEREVEYCAFCKDYVCDKLEPVFKMCPDAKDTLEKMR